MSLIHSEFSVEKLLSLLVPPQHRLYSLVPAPPRLAPPGLAPPRKGWVGALPSNRGGGGRAHDVTHSDFLPARRRAAPPSLCDPARNLLPSKRSSSACPCRAEFPWPVLPVPGNCSGWADSDASSAPLPLVSRPFPHRRCLPLLPYPWLPVPVKVSPAWRSILCGNWVKPTHSGLSCPFPAGPIFPENTCHHTHSARNYPSQHVRLRQDSVEGKKPHNIKQRKTEHGRRFEPRKKEEETITRSEESGRSPIESSASWNCTVQQPPPKASPLLWVPNATEPFLLAGMIHMILCGLKCLEAGFWFPPRDWSQAMGVRVLNPNCWTTPGTSAQWQAPAFWPCRNELPQRRKVVKHVKCYEEKEDSMCV